MPTVNRPNRKATDEDIVRLNRLALSLRTIGAAVGIHASSVAQRLKLLGIPPANTRRNFMEEIILELTDDHANWLVEQLNNVDGMKVYVKNLIHADYHRRKGNP